MYLCMYVCIPLQFATFNKRNSIVSAYRDAVNEAADALNDRIAYVLNWDSLHDDLVRDNLAALVHVCSMYYHSCVYVHVYGRLCPAR